MVSQQLEFVEFVVIDLLN